MPKGIYPRTASQLRAAPANLAKGHSPEARAKAHASMRSYVDKDPEGFSERVSAGVRQVMRVPAVREKHLQGLERARKVHGNNFRGGNGQKPIDVLPETVELLLAIGFQREYPIKTRGHKTFHNPPPAYKADFGHPELMIDVEFDGVSHRPRKQKRLDEKRDAVLLSLGWKILRIKHD